MPEPSAPLRLLLVDDHPVVRRGLAALLSSLPGIAVVGEAADGEGAVREAQLLAPDVVVMDVQMPGVDGIEATRRITEAVPSCAVLVLTMFEDATSAMAALRAGAKGYLLKGASQDEIARAIDTVGAGDIVLGKAVAAEVLGRLNGHTLEDCPFPELTVRERQILDRIAAGQNNAAIAAGLELASKTVSNHISTIFAKLRVASRAEAIVRARDAGLGRT